MPSVIPCIFSLLISRIHSSLFSVWRRTLLSKFFDTQIPSISTEELVLPLISLELAESRILARPADTSHLIVHCPATGTLRRSVFGDSLSTTSGPGPGESFGFWGSMVFRYTPSRGRSRVTTTAQIIRGIPIK